jgi:hypothetical protein
MILFFVFAGRTRMSDLFESSSESASGPHVWFCKLRPSWTNDFIDIYMIQRFIVDTLRILDGLDKNATRVK